MKFTYLLFFSPKGSDCGIVNVNIPTSGAEIGGAFGKYWSSRKQTLEMYTGCTNFYICFKLFLLKSQLLDIRKKQCKTSNQHDYLIAFIYLKYIIKCLHINILNEIRL